MAEKRKVMVLFILFFLFFGGTQAWAKEEKFATIVNPVRGDDFWQLADQQPQDFIIFQKDILKEKGIKATWLLRPDFLFSQDYSSLFLKEEFKQDEKGLFLEITPAWAKIAGVNYPTDGYWSLAKNIFLSGYNRQERKKLIDSAFTEFKNQFGCYPLSVGAWHIDPYSASYMAKTYEVKVTLICSDQASTDGYQIWGGWWGVPFYPAERNLLIPAATEKDKLGTVVLWWAVRDPLNAYGRGVEESTFSVQANDYLTYHDLDIGYFSKLADLYLNPYKGEFGQLTIGLENDNRLSQFGEEFGRQVRALEEKGVIFKTAGEFADWYKEQFPNLSPAHEIGGRDILGTGQESRWIMDLEKRVGLIKDEGGQWLVRDLRFYQPTWPDPHLWNRNLSGKLFWNLPAEIDSLTKADQLQGWIEGEKLLKGKQITPYQESSWLGFCLLIVVGFFLVFSKEPLWLKVPLLSGAGLFSTIMIRSGKVYDFGMGFWGPNGHDGIWHLSLINQLIKKVPPQNPVFSGSILYNYHWGFNLLAAWLVKLLPFSAFDIYFLFLPVIFAFLFGYLSFRLGKEITGKSEVGFWFALFNFFAGSLGWVITLGKEGKIGGESLFWSMQSISALINPPFALSLVVLLGAWLIWHRKRKGGSWQWGVLVGIIFGILTGIKIYAGILAGLGLFSFWLLKRFWQKEKNGFNFSVWVAAGIVSLVILLKMGVFSAQPALIVKPFWFLHSLIESLDKLYWPKLAILRQNLVQQWFSWKLPFLLIIELSLLFIFLVGNLGVRVFGVLELGKKIVRKKLTDFDQLLLFFLIFALLFPLFFVQRGTTWNTIQFFYYFLFIANFYLATFFAQLLKRGNKKSYFLSSLLILFLLPTTFSTLKGYWGDPPPAAIPNYELEGLNFLKRQPDGIVLAYPYDKYKNQNLQTPIPLYLYETTAYVSALSEKVLFLEDEMNLEITGYLWRERRGEIEEFFSGKSRIQARGFLLNNNIDYIYLVNDQILPFQLGDLGLEVIFANGQVRIYRVTR